MGISEIQTSKQQIISHVLSMGLITLMYYCIPRSFYISQVLFSEVYADIDSPACIQIWQFISHNYFYLSGVVLCLSITMLSKSNVIKKIVFLVSLIFVLSVAILSYFLLYLAEEYKVPVTTPYGISLSEFPMTIYLCFGYLIFISVNIFSMNSVRINEND